MMIPTIEELEKLNFEEPQAVHLLLYAIHNRINEKFVKISAKDKTLILKTNLLNSKVTNQGLEITLGNSTFLVESVEGDVDLNIEEYRSVFKGTKNGAMGIKNIVRQNLIDFLYKNSKYNMKDIISAAKKYKESLESYKYMRQADYFIYKQQYPGAPKTSTLLDVLESPDNYKSRNVQWQRVI
jgi:hypothetical protein